MEGENQLSEINSIEEDSDGAEAEAEPCHSRKTKISEKSCSKENVSPNNKDINPASANSSAELTPQSLLQILQQSIIGQDIIARASKGVLSERRQLELADVVAEWHLAHRKKLYEENLKTYAKTITLLFKNEKLVSHTEQYFHSSHSYE